MPSHGARGPGQGFQLRQRRGRVGIVLRHQTGICFPLKIVRKKLMRRIDTYARRLEGISVGNLRWNRDRSVS